MAVAGLRDSDDFGTDERPKNFRELILWRDPNGSAPLTALMARMKKETTDDPEFNWWEEEQKAIRVKLAAQVVTAGVTLTLDTGEDAAGEDLVAGDLLMVEEIPAAGTSYGFEIVQISSVVSSASVVVTRGAAGTTANTGTVVTDVFLLKIGSAYEEGSTSPSAASRNPTKYNNYCQIFKTTYNVTNTAKQTRYRTGDVVKNDKKRKAFDHSVALEQAWLFGNPSETTGTAGHPLRYTGGLYYFLTQNYNATTKPTIKVWTTTAVDEDDILDATYGMWDYNVPESGSQRIGLCGNGFLNYLNKIANSSASSRINFDKEIMDVFGMRLMRWTVPQGEIFLRTHPLMNTNSLYTNGCFIINPPGVRYRPLRGRDTMFKDNIQANDADQQKGQWLTEAGVEFNHLRSMRYLGIHV